MIVSRDGCANGRDSAFGHHVMSQITCVDDDLRIFLSTWWIFATKCYLVVVILFLIGVHCHVNLLLLRVLEAFVCTLSLVVTNPLKPVVFGHV